MLQDRYQSTGIGGSSKLPGTTHAPPHPVMWLLYKRLCFSEDYTCPNRSIFYFSVGWYSQRQDKSSPDRIVHFFHYKLIVCGFFNVLACSCVYNKCFKNFESVNCKMP